MNKKKLLALLMALVMTLTLVPVTALATEIDPEQTGGTHTVTFELTDAVGRMLIANLDTNTYTYVTGSWNDGINTRNDVQIAFTQTVQDGDTATRPVYDAGSSGTLYCYPYYNYNATQPNNGEPKTFTSADSGQYTFDGWATDDNELYDFENTPVTTDLTLHPRFSATGATIEISNETDLRHFLKEVQLGRNFITSYAQGSTGTKQTVRLMADITLSGENNWTPIPVRFSGDFDGNGHKISGVNISDSSQYAGFFKVIKGINTVSNLTLENPTVTSTSGYVGALAGEINGTATNCAVTGTINVSGTGNVGGMFGHATNGSSISGCSVTGDSNAINLIQGTGYDARVIGGMIGNTDGAVTMTNCSVSNVTVQGYRKLGGLVGQVGKTINCTGASVSNVTLTSQATTAYDEALQMGGLVGVFVAGDGDTISGSVGNVTITGPDSISGSPYVAGVVSGGMNKKNASDSEANMSSKSFNVTVSGANSTPIGGEDSTYAGILSAKPSAPNYVAQVNEGQKYETLAEAVAAVPTDGTQTTIKLLQDVALTTYVGFAKEKNVILDLNGKNIVSSGRGAIDPYGKLTIQDTSTNADGKISATAWGIWTNAGAEVTIESGSVEAGDWAIVAQGTGAKVIVNGGRVYSENGNAISGIGNDGDKGYTITVNGGEVISDNSVAIYHPNVTTLTVAGGTVKGATAIYQKSGTLDITGGTITATGAKAGYIHEGDGCTATGDAIVIENCAYPSGAPSARIMGATITSANGKQIGYYVYEDKAEGTVVADKAYTLNTNVPAKGWVANSGNNASTYPKAIGTPEAVAKVGDVQYGTLAAAIEAANETGNCTVSLLRDYNLESNEPGLGSGYWCAESENVQRDNSLTISGNNITLDLGGFELSNLFNMAFLVTGENVTIKNGSMRVGALYDHALGSTTTLTGESRICSYVIGVENAKNFVVNDLTTYGGINVWGSTATVTINNLHFSGTKFYAVCSQEGASVTLNGGTYNKAITGAASSMFWVDSGASMKITGGRFEKAGNVSFFLAGKDYTEPIVTGGVFNFDPSNIQNKNCVADGYEAVQLTSGEHNGWWQVGKVVPTASTTGDPSTSNEVIYTVGTVIKDGDVEIPNSSTIGQQVTIKGTTDDPNGSNRYDTISVNDPDNKTAVGAAALSSLKSDKVAEIVAAAVESAGTQAADVTAINVVLVSDKGSEVVDNTITYEVHPEAIVYKNNDAIGSYVIQNEDLGDTTFTFKLNVSALNVAAGAQVNVVHQHNGTSENMGTFVVDSDKNITLTVGSFSEFDISAATEDDGTHFEFLGIGLRRRVLKSDHITVVSNATDIRFGYELKGYVDSNTYYFQWKKQGGDWSSPIEITNFNANHTEAALVVNNVPKVSFGTTIYTRIFMVDSSGNTYVLEGTEMSVNDAINTISADPVKYTAKWADYAAYLLGTRGAYSISDYDY